MVTRYLGVTTFLLEQPDGATPLDPDESEGLLPTHIATLGELNEWEQANIATAHQWAFERKRSDMISPEFIRQLHRRMFDQTWRWAGSFRRSGKTMGIHWAQISVAVADLCHDVAHWILDGTFAPDELAARLHHRLTRIHPFPNGNGRHARLMADLLLFQVEEPPFTWGRGTVQTAGDIRAMYIKALRAADRRDVEPLLDFVRR